MILLLLEFLRLMETRFLNNHAAIAVTKLKLS